MLKKFLLTTCAIVLSSGLVFAQGVEKTEVLTDETQQELIKAGVKFAAEAIEKNNPEELEQLFEEANNGSSAVITYVAYGAASLVSFVLAGHLIKKFRQTHATEEIAPTEDPVENAEVAQPAAPSKISVFLQKTSDAWNAIFTKVKFWNKKNATEVALEESTENDATAPKEDAPVAPEVA